MNALVLTHDFALTIEELPDLPPAAGELLVRVEGAGICGSDTHGVATRSPRRKPPLVMGHEFVGRVIGRGVDTPAELIGKRVAVNPQVPCRSCIPCRSGGENFCADRELLGGTRPGGFAETVCAPVSCIHEVTEDLPGDVAVLAEPLATCVHAFRLVSLAIPGTVVVIGGGPIGLLAAKLARHAGAGSIIVSEADDERREWAKTVADIATSPDVLDDAVAETIGRHGVDLVIDAVGIEATRATSVQLLAPGGTAVWLGMHDADTTIPAFDVVVHEQRIQGSFAYTNADFSRSVALLEREPEAFRLPSRRFALTDGSDTFDSLTRGGSEGFLKAILIP